MCVGNIGKAGRCRTTTPLLSLFVVQNPLYRQLWYDAKFEIRISKSETNSKFK